ncbi:AAA family ATPase [Micromonospora sp. DH14]|uniref:AAA family ATPase n=1 Tax=Micromonospora sp. DH14 TaxID=3040120 RepID=UPI0024421FE5|nr:AAA family ATPase [Micromonospora sp. DH14]MDG9674795.1 tunicamycin resistance protein [Micromonospora sp. DH14]
MRVIWINGAFGAGKTTLSEALTAADPRLLLFDAELPGFMLRQIVPPPASGDFQDLRVWRRSVADTAIALLQEYGRTLVVPMTVVVPSYLEEIFGRLRAHSVSVDHFFIDVPFRVLQARIEAQSIWPDDPARDGQVRTWRLQQVARCAAAVGLLPADTVVLEGELPVAELASQVLARSVGS